MKKVNYLLGIILFTLSLYGRGYGGTLNSADESNNELPSTVSIILVGKRGSGITSTVRQLLGPKVTIHAAEVVVASTDILEYTLRLQPSSNKQSPIYLKFVDVPGLELVDNLEHDAEILSTLKSYLHDKGLPTFLMVVYRFDDKQISQPDSQFRQLLKRVEYFQQALFHTTTDNIVFLLTRLLNEPLEVQQSPNERVAEFRAVIQQAMSLSDAEILVGDNKPDANTVQMEKGFIKLPNGELYPKNIWEKLVQVADRTVVTQQGKDIVKDALTIMIENRETAELHTQELVAHATDEDTFESDLEAFEYLLRQNSVSLPRNDIQLFLQLSYENQDVTTQIASCAQLLALQICLRNLKLESIGQLPQSLAGVVKLFQQDMEGVMTSKYSLFYLKHALDLDVPEYPAQNLVVGYGYDLVNDKLLKKSPFLRNSLKRPSSSLGYQFPDYMECEKLTSVEEVILANSTETTEEYQTERLKSLTLSDRDDVVISQLKGKSKAYLNLKSGESGKLVAGKEIRILECKMTVDNDSIAIVDGNFIAAVNGIAHLNTSDAESVAQWNLFFHQYGTHVVVKGFGGGSYQGTLFLPQGENTNVLNRDKTGEILNNIVTLGDLNTETKGDAKMLVYQFHVNNGLDNRVSHLNLLKEEDKTRIVNEWKNELNFQFEMLENELELVPISQIVAIADAAKGHDAVTATKLLLQGKLNVSVQSGSPGTDIRENKSAKIARAKSQAEALKLAHLEKITKKYDQFNKFLDGTAE